MRFSLSASGKTLSKKPIKPRERIIRSIFGRAEDCIKRYDKFLEINGRKNVK